MGFINMSKIDIINKMDKFALTKIPTLTKARMLFWNRQRIARVYVCLKLNYERTHRKINIL